MLHALCCGCCGRCAVCCAYCRPHRPALFVSHPHSHRFELWFTLPARLPAQVLGLMDFRPQLAHPIRIMDPQIFMRG